jgi:hypothetical protein
MSLTYHPPRLEITETVLAARRVPYKRLSGQITTVFQGVGYVLLGLCLWTSLVGCSLGVARAQQLPEDLPQEFRLSTTATQVWQVVVDEARAHTDCLLAAAPTERLISWCESVENWRDLGQDTLGPEPRPGGVNPDRFEKRAHKPGKGTAVTTIWIEDQGAECVLHIRRVYFGVESFPGAGHSRGEYERALYQRLLQQLQVKQNKA